MMPMAHQIKTWPAKFKYPGEKGIPKRIVTEIKRPEPEACLVLKPGDTVELTQEQYVLLFHGEKGPLLPDGVLVPVHDAAPPAPPAKDPPKDTKEPGGETHKGASDSGKTGDKK